MIDSFFIYSHELIPSLLPGFSSNPDFLTTWDRFTVENRVSNLIDAVGAVSGKATGFVQVGGALLQNQSGASDAVAWLPRFRNSGSPQDGNGVDVLPYGRRMTFTYRVDPSSDPVANIQTSYIGYKETPGTYSVELVRPYQQNFPKFVIPAGQSVKQQITIDTSNDLLVRAFIGSFPSQGVSVMIRDIASGYNLMNTETMIDNFTYDLAAESNFTPRPFSPWIAPKGRTYQVTMNNLLGFEVAVNFSFWGTLCNFTVK